MGTILHGINPWDITDILTCRCSSDRCDNHLFRRRECRSDVVIGFDQFNVRDAECLGQFVKSNHGRVPSTALETAEILLAEAGARFNFFLGQVFLPTQAGKVPADQFAHIHAQ